RGRVIGARLVSDGKPVLAGGTEKMSKSKNNGVDPQAMVDRYGADTVRLFSMFASPPTLSLEWNEAGVEGMSRFLRRIWRMVHDHASTLPVADSLPPRAGEDARGAEGGNPATALTPAQKTLRRQLHETIQKVNDD